MKQVSIIMIFLAVMVIAGTIFGAGLFSSLDTYNGISCEVFSMPTSSSESYILDYKEFCEDQGAIVEIETNGEGFYWAVVNTLCYSCDGTGIGDTEIWADNRPCDDDSFYDGQVPYSDIVKYTSGTYSFSDLEDEEYCYEESEPETTKCYQCDGDSIDEKRVEGDDCPSGWTDDNNIVCNNDDEPSVIPCYQCDLNGESVNRDFVDVCPIDWSENKPLSCLTPTLTKCYSCESGELNYYTTSESCAPGYQEEMITDCKPTIIDTIKFYFDFENNSQQAILLSVAIIFVIFALIISVRPKSTSEVKL